MPPIYPTKVLFTPDVSSNVFCGPQKHPIPNVADSTSIRRVESFGVLISLKVNDEVEHTKRSRKKLDSGEWMTVIILLTQYLHLTTLPLVEGCECVR